MGSSGTVNLARYSPVVGHKDANIMAHRSQNFRQCPDDITHTTYFGKRRSFSGHKQNFHIKPLDKIIASHRVRQLAEVQRTEKDSVSSKLDIQQLK